MNIFPIELTSFHEFYEFPEALSPYREALQRKLDALRMDEGERYIMIVGVFPASSVIFCNVYQLLDKEFEIIYAYDSI